jgi:anti-sigma factor RsiW
MTEHITHEMLQLLADGELSVDAAQSVQNHLRECASCSATFGAMVKFDRFARAMPVPVLRREFAQDLLSRLGIRPPTPFLSRMVEHAASVIAVFLVVFMGATIGALVSLSNEGEGVNQEFPGQKVVSVAVIWMERAYSEFGDWLSRIVPLVFGSQTAKIAVMLLLMVPLVALVDWLVGRKGTEGEI